jgi:hypothetical protein
MTLTSMEWAAQREVLDALHEDELLVFTPYKEKITIMRKHGTWLVQANHDGTDGRGDIETLKALCLLRYNYPQGE